MRTTIELPSDLVAEAMELTHARTKTLAITMGLQELIHKYRLDQLRALRGRVDLSLDVRKSRQR
jgi:Arc/MetJ family transcription regulator